MDFIEILKRELNPSSLITDEDMLISYSTDESEEGPYLPQAAYLPSSALEVEILLKLAAEHRFPVTPRGLGTGKSGGALPVTGGVVLALDKMNKILDIDEKNMFAVLEPGVVTQDLHNAAWEHRLFYPPDPASLDSCSVGGNVSENAGGPRAFKYGVTRDFVLALDVVTMGGHRFQTGHKSVKGVSGYDLAGLLTGSEGTLGVFTRIFMKLIPRPKEPGIIMLYYDSFTKTAEALNHLLRSGLYPMSMEIMDENAIAHVRGISGFNPPEEVKGAVLCEIEGLGENENILKNIIDILEETDLLNMETAFDSSSRNRIWEARRKVSTRLKELHKHKISEDIAVPRGAIPEMVNIIDDISRKHGLEKGCYGHAGDGNLHVNFVSDEEQRPVEVFERAVEDLFNATVAMGGTLSGEHGIGISKKRFMQTEHAPFALEIMKSVKKVWDPMNLMNPGKILRL